MGPERRLGERLWGVCVLCPQRQETVNEQGQEAVSLWPWRLDP